MKTGEWVKRGRLRFISERSERLHGGSAAASFQRIALRGASDFMAALPPLHFSALRCAKRVTSLYFHTQPWSWKAILLYISIRFRLQRTDTFSHYENQYGKAMEALKSVVPEEAFGIMQESSDQ